MKRILIQIISTQRYVWVNYPRHMQEYERDAALDKLYGEAWRHILVEHSVTLSYARGTQNT